MTEDLTPQEIHDLRRTVLRASEQGWGIAVGLMLGLGLLVATVALVIKGGPDPGPHLSLLAIYFPGYSVTWLGSFIGFVYAFVVGYAIGRTVAAIYNRLIRRLP
jgi:hypothetical protein